MSQEQLFASFILDHQAGIEIALPAEQVIEATPIVPPSNPCRRVPVFLKALCTCATISFR